MFHEEVDSKNIERSGAPRRYVLALVLDVLSPKSARIRADARRVYYTYSAANHEATVVE